MRLDEHQQRHTVLARLDWEQEWGQRWLKAQRYWMAVTVQLVEEICQRRYQGPDACFNIGVELDQLIRREQAAEQAQFDPPPKPNSAKEAAKRWRWLAKDAAQEAARLANAAGAWRSCWFEPKLPGRTKEKAFRQEPDEQLLLVKEE